MLIRKLTENLEAIWNLEIHALTHDPDSFFSTLEEVLPQGKEQIKHRLHGGKEMFYLGAFEEALIGMAFLRRAEQVRGQHTADISSVYVLPEKRGQRIGRALMQELIAQAKQMEGLEQLHLAVLSTNQAAQHLYHTLGFEVVGRIPRAMKVDEQYCDDVLMVLDLQ